MHRRDWEHLIPHAGAMCLLDDVVHWNDGGIHARARSHRSPDNPLRSDGMLRSVHLCEYGAQAMAVHGGLLAQRAGKTAAPGFLVSLRAVQLHVPRLDEFGAPLEVYADALLAADSGWQYAFRVECAGRLLGEGRAAVMHRGV